MSITTRVEGSIREQGLIPPGTRVLALLSGGADSVCLVHALRKLLGPSAVTALHVNHGLRPAAHEDERFCVALCEQLGVELHVEHLEMPRKGNVEAAAREARYSAAGRLADRLGHGRVATGHTASDQVETILYRLVSSPGRRALLGMKALSGRLVRPLLGVSRLETREYCRAAGLSWREDETNLDRSLARNRLRLDVLPLLREIHSAAERNVLATAEVLSEEAELLERLVDEAEDQVAATGGVPAVDSARLAELPVPLRRLLLRRLAEEASGEALPMSSARVREIEALATRGGSASLDIGGGVRAVSEYGVLRFQRHLEEHDREPASLAVPGRCRFGEWEVVSEMERHGQLGSPLRGSADEPLLDAAKLGESLTVRAWREGDRMQPLGLSGTKSLQDLFTDRKVPRSLRHTLPVIESQGEIAWVAGVAVSELFKITRATERVVRLRALASS